MIITGSGRLISEDLKLKGSAVNYIYKCEVNGVISSEPVMMSGEGIVDKD